MKPTSRWSMVSLLAVSLSVSLPLPAHAVFSVDRDTDFLYTYNPNGADNALGIQITLTGEEVCTSTGLAAQPTTGTMFALLQVEPQCNQWPVTLATVDPATGTATAIGDLGENLSFTSIVFADQNTLYGSTDLNGDTSNTLFSIDPTDASTTPICKLVPGSGFESATGALAYANGLLFYATQDCNNICDLVIEVIDPADFPSDPADPCPITEYNTGLFAEPTALTASYSTGVTTLTLGIFNVIYGITIPDDPNTSISVNQLRSVQFNIEGFAESSATIARADVYLDKSFSRVRIKGKRTITYQITVGNNGPDTATSILMRDNISPGQTLVSYDDTACDLIGDSLECPISSLPANDSVVFSFTTQASCKKCSQILNAAAVELLPDVYNDPSNDADAVFVPVKGKF